MYQAPKYNQATLTVKEVQQILRIGQVAAYALVQSGVFPVVRVDRSYRIPQESFVAWMHAANQAAKAQDTAVANDSCILTQLKNGGLRYGR